MKSFDHGLRHGIGKGWVEILDFSEAHVSHIPGVGFQELYASKISS
jgi:hypothetical protein